MHSHASIESASAAMADFVQRRLGALLRKPDGWGPPHAVELQFLLLVEMWHVVGGAAREHVDGVSERYDRYLGRVLPGPPFPLALRLKLGDTASDEFVGILWGFLREEQRHDTTTDLVQVAQARAMPENDDQIPVAAF